MRALKVKKSAGLFLHLSTVLRDTLLRAASVAHVPVERAWFSPTTYATGLWMEGSGRGWVPGTPSFVAVGQEIHPGTSSERECD